MTGRSDGRWRGPAVTAGLLVIAVALAVVGIALHQRDGLQVAANLAQLVALIFAVPGLVALLLQFRRSVPASLPVPMADRLAAAKNILVDAVAAQWRDEAVLRDLDDPDPIPVHWRVTKHDYAMDNMENISTDPIHFFAASSKNVAKLAQQFHRLRRPRLAILGQ